MYVVLKVYKIYFVGDWSNGMIGVSKTFGGSSILSSPAMIESWKVLLNQDFSVFLFYQRILIRNWTAGTVYVILIL